MDNTGVMMKISFEPQCFVHCDNGDIVVSLFLLDEQEEAFYERFPLDSVFELEFEAHEIPSKNILSMEGKENIEALIKQFRFVADAAEKRLSTYTFK